MIKLGLATATYNEAANISHLLSRIWEETLSDNEVAIEVLVIDDSSPDGTAQLVRESAKKLNRPGFHISVLVRPVKDGLGRAYIAGFNQLLGQGVDNILQMDADLSHDPVYISDFLKAIRAGHDMVVASRYIKGGGTPDWPWSRKLLSKFGNLYASLFLSRAISDYTGGFNLFSRTILQRINFKQFEATGYGFLIELKFRALGLAKSPKEIPIIFQDRKAGLSKLPKSTLVRNLLLVARLRLAGNQEPVLAADPKDLTSP